MIKFKIFSLLLILLLNVIKSNGQDTLNEMNFQFIDHSFEEVKIGINSFNFIYKVGLSNTIVSGTLNRNGDTLIFNSDYQPNSFEVSEFYDYNLRNGIANIKIIDNSCMNQISVYGMNKWDEKINLGQKDEFIFKEIGDSIICEYNFLIEDKNIIRKKGFYVKLWRKNFHALLKFKKKESNTIILDLITFPSSYDYIFFTNIKAIIEDKKYLRFIEPNNNLIRPKFFVDKKDEAFWIKKDKETKLYTKKENDD